MLWCPARLNSWPSILSSVDLHKVSQLESILFADDTNRFISNKDPVYLNDILKGELNKLSAWFATTNFL